MEKLCTHARDIVVGTDAFLEQTISDLPREDGGALALVEGDLAYDFSRGYARLTATDRSGPDRSGFIVPAIIIICGTIRYTLTTLATSEYIEKFPSNGYPE